MAKKYQYVKDLIRQHRSAPGYGADISGVGGIGEAERIAAEFDGHIYATENDRNLTAEGKHEAIATLVRTKTVEIEKWHAQLRAGLDTHEAHLLGQLRGAVTPARSTDPTDRVEAAMLRAEVRRTAASLNEHQLAQLYRTGTPVIREALTEVPRIVVTSVSVRAIPFVSAETRDEVLIAAGREVNPDAGEMLDRVRDVRGAYQTIAIALTAMVKAEAPEAIAPSVTIR